jgi:myo-inositol-1-phosphate synthase
MSKRRVGIWFIGALGGVASTAALGMAALRRGLMDMTGMVTGLPLFAGLDLDEPGQFVVGGHDIRRTSYPQAVEDLHRRSNVFEREVIEACLPDLEAWTKNIRPGNVLNAGTTISAMADLPEVQRAGTPLAAIDQIRKDLQAFQSQHRLEQVVVVSVASTEPPFTPGPLHQRLESVRDALEQGQKVLPASSLYAWAALDLGLPYINFTPSLGASFPAAEHLAQQRKAVFGGQDGKTGETLMKTILAPMFAQRHLQVLSWVGHNIFGNRDGLVLDNPENKQAKILTKDQVITDILGYKPQTHVSIEYIPSLDDWKTAWDHIHFRGFLGVKMMMQFTWQGCDSILAAPLVLDLARLALFAQRRGEVGLLRHLACFFKNPLGVQEHDFFKQAAMLEAYVRGLGGERS